MERIAFLGTRKPNWAPPEWYSLYLTAARRVGEQGRTLLVGADPGADQDAANVALQAGGSVELYLPWADYEKLWVRRMEERYPGRVSEVVFQRDAHTAWVESIVRWHPTGKYLSRAVMALNARNYGLLVAAGAAVALPLVRVVKGATGAPDATEKSSTGQEIELARLLNLRVFDLSEAGDRSRLSGWLEL